MNKNSKLSDAPNDNHFRSSEIGKGKSKWNDWYIYTCNIYTIVSAYVKLKCDLSPLKFEMVWNWGLFII